VNNDGWADFLIADMSATTHYKQKTSMGSMGDYREFLMTAEPRQYMRNALFVNTGMGRFMEAAFLAGVADTDWTWAVKMMDLDNDGWLDLFFSNGSSRDFTNSDIPYDANLMVGRTDWDLYEHTPERREQNLAYRNLGDLKFDDVSKPWGLDHVGMSMSTAHADLDRDGDLDLIVANLNEPVSILRNTSTTGHRLLVRLYGVRDNRYGVGSTLTLRTAAGTQTRYLNPWTGYLGSNEPVVHFGLGKESMVDQLTIRWPSGQVQVLTNLKGDREYEIVQEKGTGKQLLPDVPERPKPLFVPDDALTAAVHRETFFDDYKRQSLIPNQMSQLGPGMAWGNLEAEAEDDSVDVGSLDGSGVIYIGGAAGQAGSLWRNEPTGKFTKITMPALDADAQSEDMGAVWFDLDSDGDQDLYVVSGSVECEPGDEVLRDRLYINNSGVLTPASQSRMPDLRQSGSVVIASDFDRGGDLDLFVGGRVVPGHYPETPESYLLLNDQGHLVEVTDDLAPGLKSTGLVTSAIWSDVNNDGWIDLLVTH